MTEILTSLSAPPAAATATWRHEAHVADDRPTVCHVLHALDVGGGEVLAHAFAMANAREFRPAFALLDDLGVLGQELRSQGCPVAVLGRRPGFDLQCARRLGAFLRRERVALIHAHQYAPLFYSALARAPRRIPILFTEHGRDCPDFRRWKRVWANRLLLSSRDRFVAVGQGVRQALIAFEGLPAHRVEVIYNGRNLAAFDPQRPQRVAVREELGLADDAPVIVQVARLNRLKDQATALRAMRRLAITHPRVVLLIVGDGKDRQPLERQIHELGLASSIQMLGARRDVPRLLQAADVALLSSISEGIPLTLIEAMATGLPCVATRVGGVSEVVQHEETGLLAEAGDDRGLAVHLARLLDSRELRTKMGRAGQRRAAELFDDAPMHAAYTRLYREMLA